MYKELIRSIQWAVIFNHDNADKADVQRSSYSAGMVNAYAEVLRGLGHDVRTGSYDDDKGCDRIAFVEIDGVDLVDNSKLNIDAYGKLLKK